MNCMERMLVVWRVSWANKDDRHASVSTYNTINTRLTCVVNVTEAFIVVVVAVTPHLSTGT